MNTSDLYCGKRDCTGCGLCAYVCPLGIIEMKMDEEGFLYPSVSEPDRCVNCGKCLKCCPVKNNDTDKSGFTDYYAGYASNTNEVIASSSGGLAAVIAQNFVSEGGVVYGVSYSDDWHKALYKRAVNIEETECFRSSKYIQAEKNGLYQQIDQDLKNNKRVLVFGVPCDIAAVKHRFGHSALLYLVEIICHGPTSQRAFDDYCTRLEHEVGAEITFFSCRYKNGGRWKPYYNFARFANGREFKEVFQTSDYGVAFQVFKRPSCNQCVFKDSRLMGDLMLGDYHYAQSGMPEYHESGVSVILPHNEKGIELIPMKSHNTHIFSVTADSALMNRAIHEAIPARSTRTLFYKKWKDNGLHSACCMKVISLEKTLIKVKNKIRHISKKARSILIRQHCL